MNKRRNITIGQKFGEWTVIGDENEIYVNCRCSCGKERKVYKYSLTRGKSQSCGHLQFAKKLAEKNKLMVGKKFGKWTVLKVMPNRQTLCVCECGKQKIVNSQDLLQGTSLSCGCARIKGREEQSKTALAIGVDITKELGKEKLGTKYVGRRKNKNSTTGITGVALWHNKKTGETKYRAHIMVHRKQIGLGLFDDIESAVQARKLAEEKYFVPLQARVDAIISAKRGDNNE